VIASTPSRDDVGWIEIRDGSMVPVVRWAVLVIVAAVVPFGRCSTFSLREVKLFFMGNSRLG
jgi:hypothetical protein